MAARTRSWNRAVSVPVASMLTRAVLPPLLRRRDSLCVESVGVSMPSALRVGWPFGTSRTIRMAKAPLVPIVKGFHDILPAESRLWGELEDLAATVFGRYGFGEIRLPILERAELFAR